MLVYSNGDPAVLGPARTTALGLGNRNKQIQIRTTTNPAVGSVTTRILPPTANIFNGNRNTFPALGAGAPANVNDADVADRVLNTDLSRNAATGRYDLRQYRGMSLASGAYNNPYNTDMSYGSIYAYSTQYPDGIAPFGATRPYPFSGPYNGPDFDLRGYSLQNIDKVGNPVVVLDAARGFNVDPCRGSDCRYITGILPDAARGFNVDPCTGYTQHPYRGYLANAFGGDINIPFAGLDFNPQTGRPLGRNPCGQTGDAYGTGATTGSSFYQNVPYGLSACNDPFQQKYPTIFGDTGNLTVDQYYASANIPSIANDYSGAPNTSGVNVVGPRNGAAENGLQNEAAIGVLNGSMTGQYDATFNGTNSNTFIGIPSSSFNGVYGNIQNGLSYDPSTGVRYGSPLNYLTTGVQYGSNGPILNGLNGAQYRNSYTSPFAWPSAGGCKSCAAGRR